MGSELTVLEPLMSQKAVQGKLVQEFASRAAIIQWAPIELQTEIGGRDYLYGSYPFEVASAREVDRPTGWRNRTQAESLHNQPTAPFALEIADRFIELTSCWLSPTASTHFEGFSWLLPKESDCLKTLLKSHCF